MSTAEDPFVLFSAWMEDAKASEVNDPNAMSLATATRDAVPSVRIVLCKGYGPEGFRFFTNAESRKGGELTENAHVALCFHWKTRQRQVRVEGTVGELPAADADDYFKRRHRMSQIGAWASAQSRPLASREDLLARTEMFEQKYPDEVPRPGYWKGFLVTPSLLEFWQEGEYRLHDRVIFTPGPGGAWVGQRLYP